MTTASDLKLRVFISSVQKELEEERMQLRILLTSDPFLLRYTVPKLFDKYPAPLRPDKKAYLRLLEKCQIYVLIIGKEYRDLSVLCDLGLLQMEGKGRATRYVPNPLAK